MVGSMLKKMNPHR